MSLPESILGRTWSTPDGDVTGEQVKAMYEAIARVESRAKAIGASGCSSRRVDRATQVLRKAGFIEFAGGKWRVVAQREAL